METSSSDRRGNRLLQPEMVVAIAAVLIGVCALVISVTEVRIMREGQHAAVWPRLMLAPSYSQGSSIRIQVLNPGIGPAVIRSVTATVDGQPQRSWTHALNSLIEEERSWSITMSYLRGRVVSAGETITTVELIDGTLADRVQKELDRLQLEVCYCSVFERCWTTSINSRPEESPRELPECPSAQPNPFQG